MTDFRGEYETPEDDMPRGDYGSFPKITVIDKPISPELQRQIDAIGPIEFDYAAMERMTNPIAHELRQEISRLTNSLIASNSVIAVLCRRAGGRLEITDDEFRELRMNKAPKSHNDPVTGNLIVEIDL